MINSVTAAQNQSLEQYAGAGGLATETISAIRTVTALNMQPGVITKYRKYLFEAMRVGVLKGLNVGIGNGGLFCVCFFTYALGFWYGGKLVADDMERGCTNDCLTGGNVMAVFFSTIMGSMALGQLAPPLIAFFAAKAAVARIFEVVDRKPLIDGLSEEGERPDVRISGLIELKDVIFAYPSRPNIEVCKGYNLKINPGETVALVGASGCGKVSSYSLIKMGKILFLYFFSPLLSIFFCVSTIRMQELYLWMDMISNL
jgi:ABC-type bacteriocin/lantibiotic exporter with double-glycine peptidase domain